ncbi:hypothetical protein PCE1_001610 [Barthelona sp. PCE]
MSDGVLRLTDLASATPLISKHRDPIKKGFVKKSQANFSSNEREYSESLFESPVFEGRSELSRSKRLIDQERYNHLTEIRKLRSENDEREKQLREYRIKYESAMIKSDLNESTISELKEALQDSSNRCFSQKEQFLEQIRSLREENNKLKTSSTQRSTSSDELKKMLELKNSQIAALEEQMTIQKGITDHYRADKTERSVLPTMINQSSSLLQRVLSAFEISVSEDVDDDLVLFMLTKKLNEWKERCMTLESQMSSEKSDELTMQEKERILDLQSTVEELNRELDRIRALYYGGGIHPLNQKVMHFKDNPKNRLIERKLTRLKELEEQNMNTDGMDSSVLDLVNAIEEKNSSIEVLEKEVSIQKKKLLRYQEIAGKQVKGFRLLIYRVLGWKITQNSATSFIFENLYKNVRVHVNLDDDGYQMTEIEPEKEFKKEIKVLCEEDEEVLGLFLSRVLLKSQYL